MDYIWSIWHHMQTRSPIGSTPPSGFEYVSCEGGFAGQAVPATVISSGVGPFTHIPAVASLGWEIFLDYPAAITPNPIILELNFRLAGPVSKRIIYTVMHINTGTTLNTKIIQAVFDIAIVELITTNLTGGAASFVIRSDTYSLAKIPVVGVWEDYTTKAALMTDEGSRVARILK